MSPLPAPPWGVDRLTVRFGRTAALEDVTLGLQPGRVTAVVGGDGSGKSTLLRALAGGLRPSRGTVSNPGRAAIGYVAGTRAVYSDLTVDENLAFVAAAFGVSRSDRDALARPLLERAGLSDSRNRLAADLSGGMRQKLAFALAALHRPQLLILDEPTTGLDPVSRSEVWRLIASAAASGAAVVLSTTYLDEAERASTVLVLRRGRTLLCETPQATVADVPGRLFDVPPEALPPAAVSRSWRHGSTRRVWCPDGLSPASSAVAVRPALADAVIVASLQAELPATDGAA